MLDLVVKIQKVMDEAIKNGYVKVGPIKNKNASAWTQPKDPLQIKMEKTVAEVSNIYSEGLFQHQKVDLDTFLPSTEFKFVRDYAYAHFEHLVILEQKYKPMPLLMANQPKIGRFLRMKVIDWLQEIVVKFKIAEKELVTKAVEMMDRYYHSVDRELEASDLQLTATTCLFVAAKAFMVNPFTLQNVAENMCYSKYSNEELLQKEKEVRSLNGDISEQLSVCDFINHFLRVVKYRFCEVQADKLGKLPTKIIKPTFDFMLELEVLCFELSKFMLLDPMMQRYLKSYVAASVLIGAFEILVDLMQDYNFFTLNKFDINHINTLYEQTRDFLTDCFGYKKWVSFQVFSKFIFQRLKCLYYQHSGIVVQLAESYKNKTDGLDKEMPFIIKREFANLPFILKDKLGKYLHDPKSSYLFDPFMRSYYPDINSLPFKTQAAHPRDILNPRNDQIFHNFLKQNLAKTLQFYFTQFEEMQQRLNELRQNCMDSNCKIDFNGIISSACKGLRRPPEQFLLNTTDDSSSPYSSKFELTSTLRTPQKFISPAMQR